MIFARMYGQHISIEMLIETYRINVQHLTLAGEYNENGLDAMQLFPIAQILLGLQNVVQYLN